MKRYCLNLLGVVSVVFVLASCGEKKGSAPNPATIPVPVNLFEVLPEKVVYFDKYPGTVTAMMQVDLRPEAEGYVTGMYFTEGTHVTKGQKLYTIDNSKYEASYNQAMANLKVAEANQEQAQKDADRYNYLNQHDAVAKQTLDHALTALQNTKQQVSAAKQELARTQTDLGYSVIKAPFDGVIGISQVKVGSSVIKGQTVLNTISTNDPMVVDFVVNEKLIPRFVALQQNKAGTTDSMFTILMPDNSVYGYPGQIHVIDRGVNPQTGSVIVRLKFPNQSSVLRAGMSCTVRIRNEDTSKQLVVPMRSVVEQMGEYFVYIAKDSVIAASNKGEKQASAPTGNVTIAAQKKVVLGQNINDRVIIKSGLEAGDRLIVDGVQKLHDGSFIKLGGAEGQKK